MKITRFKVKYHFPVFYLVSHISIGPVSVIFLESKDENKILILCCSGGEQAGDHHDKYSSVQNLVDSFINPAWYM